MSDDGTLASAPTASSKQTGSRLYAASGEAIATRPKPMQGQSDQLAEFIEEQPITAAMVALIVGYFIGKIT